MVEECEDLFSIQMASLPRVSVSVGRFEEETLSWERSSFSYKRQLEDLGQCSRQGSVVEKKAYFEAHFEKNGVGRRSNCGEALSPVAYNGFIVGEGIHGEDYFDESLEEMDEQDYLVMEFGRPDGTSFYELRTHSDVVINPQTEFDAACEQKDQKETSNQDGFDDQLPACVERDIKMDDIIPINGKKPQPIENATSETKVELPYENVEKLLQNGAKNAKELDSAKTVQVESSNSESDDSSKPMRPQSASSKATSSSKQSVIKSKVRPDTPTSQTGKGTRKENSVLPQRTSNKAPQRIEHSAAKTIAETTSKVPQTVTSAVRSVKPEGGSKNVSAKLSQAIGSEKEMKGKKLTSVSQQLSLRGNKNDKHASTVLRTSRSKPEIKHSGTILNLKSDERAVQNKQFNLKLEEKTFAKEKNKGQPQARTREVKEVEMKQLRKSLKFKATPMPFFYTEAAPRVHAKKQTGEITSNTKPAKQSLAATSQKPITSSKPTSAQVEATPLSQSSNYSTGRRSFELPRKKETEQISRKPGSSYQQVQSQKGNRAVAGQGRRMTVVGRGPAMSTVSVRV